MLVGFGGTASLVATTLCSLCGPKRWLLAAASRSSRNQKLEFGVWSFGFW